MCEEKHGHRADTAKLRQPVAQGPVLINAPHLIVLGIVGKSGKGLRTLCK
jgi:hypothetical protein